jgi:hypothetical protein
MMGPNEKDPSPLQVVSTSKRHTGPLASLPERNESALWANHESQ